MGKSDSEGKRRSKGRGTPEVVDARGRRRRFLRGMITHDLVQRGVGFEDAFGIAANIRDQVNELDADEISTVQLRELINQQLSEKFGPELPPALTMPPRPTSVIEVGYAGQKVPFSRGLLARSLHGAGVETERAYDLAAELEAGLIAEETMSVPSNEIARRADEMLREYVGKGAAKRYRLLRRIHNLPRPLIIYIGGASGTGKSTLSLELAPLMRIYRINATDMIRQVMRMVFTESIMPALHRSSFEDADPAEFVGLEGVVARAPDTASDAALIASFEKQAQRVVVGVRAIVERAIVEKMSIIVEGVHLIPGLVPFPDLEGAAYQVPLMLATLDEEVHRSRFLARGRRSGRGAERYLERFEAIRTIQDHLLQHSEAHDVQEIDTSSGDPPVARTLRLVTGMLENRLPSITGGRALSEEHSPTLLLIIDGLADRPVRALGGRTPLQAANTPTFDRLAREGRSGLADPVAPGVVPDTAAGSLALFAQSPAALKRGPLEALGAGLELSPGDVALRANFATIDDSGRVIDRRAGRIREGAAKLAKAIDRLDLPKGTSLDIEIRVKPSTEHRLAVALRGEGLSGEIGGSDPGGGRLPAKPLTPAPLDPGNERAVRTAQALALFERAARDVLSAHKINARRIDEGLPPANLILTRGAGRIHRLIPLEEGGLPLRMACVAGDRTIRGLAEWLGGDVIVKKRWTANLDTDLEAKFAAARKALARHDLVIVHVKGADVAAHDRRPELKAEFIERVDSALATLLDGANSGLRVAIASDHATLSDSGQHAADPLPVLIWGDGIEPDAVELFDEQAAAAGALDRFPLQMLLSRLFDLS